MYHMVLLIVYDIEQCPDVLDAWDDLNVPGITILESTGMGTIREEGIRDDLPLMPSLADLFRLKERRHRTIFTVVEGEEMVDKIVDKTEEILGSLEEPRNGVIFVLPVSRVEGLHGAKRRALGED